MVIAGGHALIAIRDGQGEDRPREQGSRLFVVALEEIDFLPNLRGDDLIRQRLERPDIIGFTMSFVAVVTR